MNFSANPIAGGQAIGATVPDIGKCPICNHSIEAIPLNPGVVGALDESKPAEVDLQVILRCPRRTCHRLFIARYTGILQGSTAPGGWQFVEVAPRAHIVKDFPVEVTNLSSRFVEIYRQASVAESAGLDQICGPGYRKSLEFLIKDFLKSVAANEDEKEAIEKEQLGNCIANRVTDPRLKSAAARAIWLGNDETHYVRKWENKDLGDLKKLIDLTVHWVSAEILTRELDRSMPDPKKGQELARLPAPPTPGSA